MDTFATIEKVLKTSYPVIKHYSVASHHNQDSTSSKVFMHLSFSRDSSCEIPELVANKTYFILTPKFEIKKLKNENLFMNGFNLKNFENEIKQNFSFISLFFDDETKVFEWKPHAIRKLRKLVEQYGEEKCATIDES